MQQFVLKPHPDHPPLAVQSVGVDLHRDGDTLLLFYRIADGSRLVRPESMQAARTDELWRATCLELFLRFDDDERYVEFNFSPSTQWAAYAFDGYREGMTEMPLTAPPDILSLPDRLEVTLDLGGLPRGEPAMALTAVIEEEGGVKSYWSLAHPPGPPDFHHAACFAARLPAPDGT